MIWAKNMNFDQDILNERLAPHYRVLCDDATARLEAAQKELEAIEDLIELSPVDAPPPTEAMERELEVLSLARKNAKLLFEYVVSVTGLSVDKFQIGSAYIDYNHLLECVWWSGRSGGSETFFPVRESSGFPRYYSPKILNPSIKQSLLALIALYPYEELAPYFQLALIEMDEREAMPPANEEFASPRFDLPHLDET